MAFDISTDRTNENRTHWWYHRVAFKDMNGDGRKDALSSRAYLLSSKTMLYSFNVVRSLLGKSHFTCFIICSKIFLCD